MDKYLRGKIISNPREIFDIIKNATNKRNLCVAIRNLLNYLEAFDLMREEDLARYRKIVRIPRTNPDSYIPDDKTVINAFSKFENSRYKIVFKLLLYSGLRIREALELLKDFDKSKLIVNGNIAKYPLNIDRKTKRSYYAYMPKSFALKLKPLSLNEDATKQYFSRRGLPAKYLRKWNYNFLILNGVPESVADFIQGRASITVGSMHYLAKVKQADEWYSRVVGKLLKIFS